MLELFFVLCFLKDWENMLGRFEGYGGRLLASFGEVVGLERPKRSLVQGFSLNGPCQRGGYTSCRFL